MHISDGFFNIENWRAGTGCAKRRESVTGRFLWPLAVSYFDNLYALMDVTARFINGRNGYSGITKPSAPFKPTAGIANDGRQVPLWRETLDWLKLVACFIRKTGAWLGHDHQVQSPRPDRGRPLLVETGLAVVGWPRRESEAGRESV